MKDRATAFSMDVAACEHEIGPQDPTQPPCWLQQRQRSRPRLIRSQSRSAPPSRSRARPGRRLEGAAAGAATPAMKDSAMIPLSINGALVLAMEICRKKPPIPVGFRLHSPPPTMLAATTTFELSAQ
eukprot:s4197_g2.t1